ncbi:MAG: FKBP-type peptidyl-prolyl cis-trans isomerase [Ferruginibacter sp.]|nr:FKBP-type peptidyl-prolyl cis-trans isomerase [Ferruginibacter sp.]
MYQKFTLILLSCFVALFVAAQNVRPGAAPVGRPVYNFKTINSSLKYVFIEDKPTRGHPQEGDDVMLRMIAICNNRFMYNSNQVNKGNPGAFSISKAAFKGDIADVLMLMSPGDSVICLVDAQSMFEYTKKPLPDYIKPGDKIQYNIRLVSIKPKEELQKEREAAMAKALQEQPVQNDAAKQMATDEEALMAYFKAKNISPVKTASGLYYSIISQGNGANAKAGDNVVMNYRGNLLDGTVFDSNIDSAFMHVQPLRFVLGTGRVIKGWEEGITYLKPGAKGFFYIPSALAYGPQSRPGSAANPKGIPANSVLIFEVELLEVK